MLAEACAWAASRNQTLYQLLIEIYQHYGLYKESLLSLTRKGKEGAEEISQMMISYRTNPPETINRQNVVLIKDYLEQKEKDIVNKTEKTISLNKSDVLQFFLADGSKITVRPSGTEPKIKYYFSVKAELPDPAKYDEVNLSVDNKINAIISAMNLK